MYPRQDLSVCMNFLRWSRNVAPEVPPSQRLVPSLSSSSDPSVAVVVMLPKNVREILLFWKCGGVMAKFKLEVAGESPWISSSLIDVECVALAAKDCRASARRLCLWMGLGKRVSRHISRASLLARRSLYVLSATYIFFSNTGNSQVRWEDLHWSQGLIPEHLMRRVLQRLQLVCVRNEAPTEGR